ncbi:MAG TPA: TRAP transporter substrate-binding protein DctP [Polyangia bacterium]
MRLLPPWRLLPLLAVVAGPAAADPPVRIRMAAEAPEGSAWAREFHAIDRDVQAGTKGRVQMRWYLGGIAGDEVHTLDRIAKGQLDGEAGALFCDKVAPSIRIGRIVGLFQSRDEWRYVMSRLLPRLNAEAARRGFTNPGVGSVGNIIFFSRRPLRTVDDLRTQRFWTWDLDDISRVMLEKMGLQMVPLPVADAARAYDEGRVDGFVATPTAALVYQWSTRAHYYSPDLMVGELPACIVVAQRALDPLPIADQDAVTAAILRFVGRFEPIGRAEESSLLGGLFERQGLRRSVASVELRAHFIAAARAAREQIAEKLVAKELLAQTMTMLADYRSERHELAPAPSR